MGEGVAGKHHGRTEATIILSIEDVEQVGYIGGKDKIQD
jgi:hypothetical protein